MGNHGSGAENAILSRRAICQFIHSPTSQPANPVKCAMAFLFKAGNHVRTCHHCPHTHTHTHPFNGPVSGTTRVSRYQKGKTNLDFTEARDNEWQCHQLGHMQVCTLLQTDNHASTPQLSFYRPDALPAAQPTASKHWRNIDVSPLSSVPQTPGCQRRKNSYSW